mmetsp:Transcript_37641/g.118892  ORF Transcript_37641/g.118892 Transcript_37641/m.118892 type:complete len:89 (+) Transcript_37641:1990-2256(+)
MPGKVAKFLALHLRSSAFLGVPAVLRSNLLLEKQALRERCPKMRADKRLQHLDERSRCCIRDSPTALDERKSCGERVYSPKAQQTSWR